VVYNSTAAELYPGCRQALETFFCSQEEVYRDDGVEPSACSAYRRPDHTNVHRCLAFCPAIRDTCPAAAYAYCQERCRSLHVPDYCNVIEVVGLEHSRYPPDTVDIMNLYRIEQEADTALLRNGRPYYRSIPARRYGGQYGAGGGGSTTKQEYFLYSTQIRGFPEWLLDTNDEDSDGAVAFVSDANMEPSKINSDWNVWSPSKRVWTGEPMHIICHEEGMTSSASLRRTSGMLAASMVGLVLPLATLSCLRRRRHHQY